MSIGPAATSAGKLLPDAPAIPSGGVLLHVGVHKTGTTAIQAALADARGDLTELGVSYPGKAQAQHRAALAILQRTWGWNQRGGSVVDRSQFDELAAQVAKAKGRVVISSEFFCEADAEKCVDVVKNLGGDRVQVLVTLRNLGRLLPSSWQQYLKYGLTKGYEPWLEDVFAKSSTSNMSPTFWRRHDHGAVLTRWAEAVGPKNVTVLILEDVDRNAMFRSFAQLLGVPTGIFTSRMDLTSNRSMTAAEAELLVRLNARVKMQMQWSEYVRLVRRGVAMALVEGREPAVDEPRLHTPDWALDAAMAHGLQDRAVISALGVNILGDLDALGVRAGSPPPVVGTDSIPIDAAVQALVAVIQEAHDAPSTKELAKALAKQARAGAKSRFTRKRSSAS
ncbi:MAG: hypothetical protein EXQ60_01430 [Candidatus Nanopelagicales bacterium]|nr:hypothetical protein [Candidatus Nanopelagicales bacterium]